MSDITDIEQVRAEVARQKKIRNDVFYLEQKLAIDGTILVGLEASLKGYVSSVADTKQRILDNSYKLERLTKLLTSKPDMEKASEQAERIAKRIEKLTKEIARLTEIKSDLM